MKKGITLLEMLVVIALMAVLSATLIPNSQDDVSLERLNTEAKSLSYKFLQLSVDARMSGRTIRVTCNPQTVIAYSHLANQSWDFNSSAARVASSPTVIDTQTIFQSKSGMSLNGFCSGNQTFYISSEGNLFSASGVGGLRNLEIRTNKYSSIINLSAAAYPTSIRIGLIGAVPVDNEI
jgi:prepilin-type N-terminal cleavage/methylation domain-containing protein